jgi:hypothetical protein
MYNSKQYGLGDHALNSLCVSKGTKRITTKRKGQSKQHKVKERLLLQTLSPTLAHNLQQHATFVVICTYQHSETGLSSDSTAHTHA